MESQERSEDVEHQSNCVLEHGVECMDGHQRRYPELGSDKVIDACGHDKDYE